MALSYKFNINRFVKTSGAIGDVLSDEIALVEWEVIGTNEEGLEGKFSSFLPYNLSGTNITFEQLTNQMVKEWIENEFQTVYSGGLKLFVDDKISTEIQNKKNTTG